jgi:hypothetical protein
MGKYATIDILSIPAEAMVGEMVNISFTVRREFARFRQNEGPIQIYGIATANGDRVIDWQEATVSDYQKAEFAGFFTMPEGDVQIYLEVRYKADDGSAVLDDSKTSTIKAIAQPAQGDSEGSYPEGVYAEGIYAYIGQLLHIMTDTGWLQLEEGPLVPDPDGLNPIYVVANPETLPPYITDGGWITIAQGATLDEIKNTYPNMEIGPNSRFVIEFKSGTPKWILSSTAWIVNASKGPLNAVGVDLTGASIEGNRIFLNMRGTPLHVILGVLLGLYCLVLISVYVLKYLAQREITAQHQADQKAAEAKAQADMAQGVEDGIAAITNDPDMTPEQKAAAIQLLLENGFYKLPVNPTGTGTGIAWEKYLKYAMIGGGVILGAAVLIPTITKSLKGST